MGHASHSDIFKSTATRHGGVARPKSPRDVTRRQSASLNTLEKYDAHRSLSYDGSGSQNGRNTHIDVNARQEQEKAENLLYDVIIHEGTRERDYQRLLVSTPNTTRNPTRSTALRLDRD